MKTNADNTDANDRRQNKLLYEIIHDTLKTEILDNVYLGQKSFPSESELCKRFNVVRNTARKALQLLVDEGYIVKVPGRASIIKEKPVLPAAAPIPLKTSEHVSPRRNILFVTRISHLKNTETEYFHLNLFNILEKKIAQIGYNLFFKPISKEFDFDDVIKHTYPAAVIFDSYVSNVYYEYARSIGLPCVSINHYTPLVTSIVSNNSSGAYQVTRELVSKGHRRIAIIAGIKDYQTTTERLLGVQSFLLENSIPVNENYFFYGNWLFNSGYEIAERICAIDANVRPTAIFAFNDDMAYGSLSYFEKRNENCLNSMSLVGFDNSKRYINMFPAISSVDVNMNTMVEYACWFLVGSLEKRAPKDCAKIQIETTYIDNGTIKAAINSQL